MRKVLFHIGFLLLLSISSVYGQQISQYSQYLSNRYLINPAASDLQNSLNIQFSYRSQKNVVFRTTDAYYVSVYGSLDDVSSQQITKAGFRDQKKIINSTVKSYNAKLVQVMGGIVSRDNFGLVDRLTAHVNYGAHIPLNKTYTLSTAATLGYVGLNVSDEYFVFEAGDYPFQKFLNGFQNQSFADVGLGVWLYSSKLQLGYSVQKLFSGNSLEADQDNSFQIDNQHFIYGAYRLDLRGFSLTPSLLFRIDHHYGRALDYTLKADYQNKIWLAGSLRNSEILVLNIGYAFTPALMLNYSYDQGSISDPINGISANEISLTLKL